MHTDSPIGFSGFFLKYEQTNKDHLTFGQSPQHERLTKVPDRLKPGRNKRQKEKKTERKQ